MPLSTQYFLNITETPEIQPYQETQSPLIEQIEAELEYSEIYVRSVSGIQTALSNAGEDTKNLIKAVAREAIRIALSHFSKQSNVVSTVSQETLAIKELPNSDSTQILPKNSSPAVINSDNSINNRQANDDEYRDLFFNLTKKILNPKIQAEIVEQEREEQLRKIGSELKQAREALSLSIYELQTKTKVLIHNIKALEAGRIDLLPEDIFVRGFIRRLGDALELDGAAMAASLPASDVTKSVIPSWHRKQPSGTFQLSPVHLYVGYAAFVAGAAGGLGWMASHSTTVGAIESNPNSSPQVSPSQSQRDIELSASITPLNFSNPLAATKLNVSPPEKIGSKSPYRPDGFIQMKR